MEATFVKTQGHWSLRELYIVAMVTETRFDWYLGEDRAARRSKYNQLKEFLGGLTVDDLLEKTKEVDDLQPMMDGIPRNMLGTYLAWVKGSVGDWHEGDTHLHFDYERLPGLDLTFTCSRCLREVMLGCEVKDDGGVETCLPDVDVRELDIHLVRELAEKWNSMTFKFNLAKWIGYFFPSVGSRMVDDMAEELGVADEVCDIHDLLGLRDTIMEIARGIYGNKERLWMATSI